MRRDHTTIFDGDAAEADDITREFWGATRGWDALRGAEHGEPHPSGVQEIWRDDAAGPTTGPLRAVREGLAAFRPRRGPRVPQAGSFERARRHGAARPTPVPREATLAELATGRSDERPGADRDDASTNRHEPVPGPPTPPRRRSSRLEAGADQPGRVHRETAHHGDRHREHAWDDERDDERDDDLIPLTPVSTISSRLGLDAVDPLLLRFGVIVLVAVLMVPLALALRGGDAGAILTDPTSPELVTNAPGVVDGIAPEAVPAAGAGDGVTAGGPPATVPATPSASATTADGVSAPSRADAVPGGAASGTAVATADAADDAVDATTEVAAASQTAPPDGGEAATAGAVAERLMPACPLTYDAAPGDSWYRIADAAGVSPDDVLAENRATVDTPIFPGDEICLPAGATVPSPPPITTSPPAAATPTAPPATTAPTTAPTTPPPTTVPRATTGQVQQLIRDVWPDDLEERALEIAWRESRFVATAHNGWCCYGVFQIYWSVHRSWLDDHGIYSATDLYDARKNIEAAYAMYQRSGGWGPWGG